MNKVTKNIICPNSKIKKSIFIVQYRVYYNELTRFSKSWDCTACFAFTALAIDKTFTQGNFLPSKIEIVSMNFPLKI